MKTEEMIETSEVRSQTPEFTLSLKEILRKGDPVLREQQRQLILGIAVLFGVIALLYLFAKADAEMRHARILLISGLVLPIINNILGFRFIGRPFRGETVLENYWRERRNIKIFLILTVVLRGFASGILLGCVFFTYKLDEARTWVLRGILLVYVVDLGVIIRIWIIRFGRLLANLDYFHSLLYPDDES